MLPDLGSPEYFYVRRIGGNGLSIAYYAIPNEGQSGVDSTSIEQTLRLLNRTAGIGQEETFTTYENP